MASDERQTSGCGKNRTREREIRPYSGLTLAELCQLIADSNFDALDELMTHRSPFETADGKRIGFVAFWEVLRNQKLEHGGHPNTVPVIERAFDLLMDRFTHRPKQKQDGKKGQKRNPPREQAPNAQSPSSEKDKDRESNGTDCRNYYREYVKKVTSSFRKKPPANETERELREAELMRHFVRRQLRYCLKEARREANPLSNRYRWETDEWDITVSFPTAFDGDARCKWLQEHVGRPDMSKPGEKERIQALIDEEFGVPNLVPMTPSSEKRTAMKQFSPSASVEKTELQGMRRFIAEEKAARIKDQPRKIRELGKTKLRRLVLAVLENWESEEKSGAELARKFHLSTATFSRFAGKNRKGKKAILVVNIARIMKANPVFLEAARHAGFLKRIVRVAEGSSEGGPHGT